MKCPHCSVSIHPALETTWLNEGKPIGKERRAETLWSTRHMACPSCGNAIIFLNKRIGSRESHYQILVYPQVKSQRPVSVEVPERIAKDFQEAAAVLHLSPKASAALSRRCLQGVLEDQGVKTSNLNEAIEVILGHLPPYLQQNLHEVRVIGNFAAHPIKGTQSEVVIDVEPHEAEWNLDVLEGLFDYFYVQAAENKKRRKAINEKLQSAGKAELG